MTKIKRFHNYFEYLPSNFTVGPFSSFTLKISKQRVNNTYTRWLPAVNLID